MQILGLTGSIGMGKTTTARLFAEMGVPVQSSDEIVHALYAGPASGLIEAAFPGTVKNGVVDREALSKAVLGQPRALARLEALIHPLVRQANADFVRNAREEGKAMVVLDIPLLFETGREDSVDRVVVVSAPAALQAERVLARPNMTHEKLRDILARQMPDAEKRRRADHVVDTSQGLDEARRQVRQIVNTSG